MTPQRVLTLSLASALAACGSDPGAIDAGTDAPTLDAGATADAGPPLVEVFADLGSASEGIALGVGPGGASVLYVGTLDDRIVRVTPAGVVTDFAVMNDPLGIAARPDGTLVVCGKGPAATGAASGIFSVAPDGTVSPLVSAAPGGAPFSLTNFVAIAPDDSLVFSDSAGDRVYRADPDGANVALVTDAITYPNGLAFSDDGTTLYVASWDTTTLYALSFDMVSGAYGAPTSAHEGTPNVDGVVPRADGRVILVTSTAGIVRVEPGTPTATATEIASSRAMPLPANAVLGDAAFGATELFVTSLGRSSLFVVHTALGPP